MSDTANADLLAAAKDAATRNVDYYALLGLEPATDIITRESVQRAWRKRSIKYHPDQAGANFDRGKWEEFGLARDILASDEARGAYDGARSALMQKQREKEAMNARQRRFVEELEEAEGRSKKTREEEGQRKAEEERERGRQAAEGRKIMEERQRLMREAEERERERERREDEARDDRERELEQRLEEIKRRKAEKRARKGGVAVEAKQPSPPPVAAPDTRSAESRMAPMPQRDVLMSDDPVQFWKTQWPKTKARLQAAQATKEHRMKEAGTAA
ncbi:Pre-mRNA-splicing factor cwf23 [Cytospora mali]|uniref:Pre-mRNA-splicing factor cwf23 n=1 Tax=Cytospora mali TaxID=578113 RepID=A0A194V5X8_CYTMA|nr:Pre-mRNA-splicing factor cwf23 [Valsa mali var. pyri (nom. inval.)]